MFGTKFADVLVCCLLRSPWRTLGIYIYIYVYARAYSIWAQSVSWHPSKGGSRPRERWAFEPTQQKHGVPGCPPAGGSMFVGRAPRKTTQLSQEHVEPPGVTMIFALVLPGISTNGINGIKEVTFVWVAGCSWAWDLRTWKPLVFFLVVLVEK